MEPDGKWFYFAQKAIVRSNEFTLLRSPFCRRGGEKNLINMYTFLGKSRSVPQHVQVYDLDYISVGFPEQALFFSDFNMRSIFLPISFSKSGAIRCEFTACGIKFLMLGIRRFFHGVKREQVIKLENHLMRILDSFQIVGALGKYGKIGSIFNLYFFYRSIEHQWRKIKQ